MNKKISFLSQVDKTFENKYLEVRQNEERVYSDEVVISLPHISTQHPQYKEWLMRKRSANRFVKYLTNKNLNSCLEIGCGNGWFSNLIAKNTDAQVLGLDVNLAELEQANSLFVRDNLSFVYGDLFQSKFEKQFDLIVFNAAIQYFPDLKILFKHLRTMLAPNGEIHIMDSAFYSSDEERIAAKERTKAYFIQEGVPLMSKYYFHHLKSDIKNFEVVYNPKNNLWNKISGKKDSPFAWYIWVNKS